MHRSYRAEFDNPIMGLHKEYLLPSGKRIDFIDILNNKIYELKPFNPRAMKLGKKQLEIYKNELNSMPDFINRNFETIEKCLTQLLLKMDLRVLLMVGLRNPRRVLLC
jgi:hypothetical protein